MLTGTVKTIHNKGFFFITRDDGQADVFAHASALANLPFAGLEYGMRVTFALDDNDRRGPRAAEVRVE